MSLFFPFTLDNKSGPLKEVHLSNYEGNNEVLLGAKQANLAKNGIKDFKKQPLIRAIVSAFSCQRWTQALASIVPFK